MELSWELGKDIPLPQIRSVHQGGPAALCAQWKGGQQDHLRRLKIFPTAEGHQRLMSDSHLRS